MAETKTWREHMLAGEPIETPDWDFFGAIFDAHEKVAAFNRLPIRDFDARIAALKDLFGKFGEGSWIEQGLRLDLGFNTEIGDRSYLNCNCTLLDTYPIRIGDDVQIGPNTMLFAVGHPVRSAERSFRNAAGEKRGLTTGAPIVIEDNVWIGGGVIVLPGVTIGARSMIGAGSVVTKSVPPDVFAAGNPCRVIKEIEN